MNSRISRPRSPIMPTTIDIRLGMAGHHAEQRGLLPTPLPANRPMRMPRPMVASALMALTPTSKTWYRCA
jgi:hypothetical protein